MADEFRAVAAMLATALSSQLEDCATAKPIPFLLMASKTDPAMAYGGLRIDARYSRAGAEDTVASFVRRNGCQKSAEREVTRSDPNDGMLSDAPHHRPVGAGQVRMGLA